MSRPRDTGRVWSVRSKPHEDRLSVHIGFDALPAALVAPAGLLVAAEGQRLVGRQRAVDPDQARLDALGQAMRTADVLGPDGRRQAIFGVVGPAEDFLLLVEGDHRADGPED